MQIRSHLLIAGLACAASGVVHAQSAPSAPEVEAKTDADPDRKVCRHERPTGSQIPTKICKTAAQWDWEHERSRKMMQDAQQRTGTTNSR